MKKQIMMKALLAATSFLTMARAQFYLPQPAELWTTSGVGPFDKGNVVQIAPDSSAVYVTTSDGKLFVLSPQDGNVTSSIEIPSRGTGWTVRCKSGISFAQGEPYFVYSIVDLPPAGSNDTIHSRVIAQHHPIQNEPRWISPFIEGEISGTPVIGSEGDYVYFTHNVVDGTLGQFSVLRDSVNGAVVFTESSIVAGTPDPYGPVAISHVPAFGNYREGDDNGNDLVAWGHLPGTSFGTGFTHGFQLPVEGGDIGTASTVTFTGVTWSVMAPPTFSSSGLDLFFGVSRGQFRAWTNGRRFHRSAEWKADGIPRSTSFKTREVPTSPTLSLDEKRLFVTPTSNTVYCLNVTNGDDVWKRETTYPIETTIRVSPDGDRIFHSDGDRVVSRSAEDGALQWEYSLDTPSGSILPEFTLSNDGRTLFYGLSFGKVTAVAVIVEAPTSAPTTLNPTPLPTLSPSSLPSLEPTVTTEAPTTASPTLFPTLSPTFAPSMAPTTSPTVAAPETAIPTVGPTTIPTRAPSTPLSAVSPDPTEQSALTSSSASPTKSFATPDPTEQTSASTSSSASPTRPPIAGPNTLSPSFGPTTSMAPSASAQPTITAGPSEIGFFEDDEPDDFFSEVPSVVPSEAPSASFDEDPETEARTVDRGTNEASQGGSGGSTLSTALLIVIVVTAVAFFLFVVSLFIVRIRVKNVPTDSSSSAGIATEV